MKVRHTSGRARVIAVPQGPHISTDENGEVDLPDPIAESLLEQSDRWEAVESKPTKAAKSGEKE